MTIRTSIRSILIGFASSATLAACKESTPPPMQGPPTKLVQIGSGPFSAPANTELTMLQISVQDANNIPLANQTVTFTVIAGGGCFPVASGGCVATATATSDANGTVTVPPWRLGKFAVEQKLEATLGSIVQSIEASVQTLYNIVVRFWGSTPVSDANKALFTNAAARIRGIVTGDIDNVQASNFDLSVCGVVGEPPLTEIIDDVVIYASIQPIDSAGDGNSNIVAQAGPCAGRPTTSAGYHTAIGIMQFDSYDFPRLGSNLQDVVTHEMMHVLGFGVYWDADPPAGRDIITGSGSGDPRYTGIQARQGCLEVGGTTTCASSIPLENAFGAGSNDSHWRESVFDREMMTSLLDSSNPISSMTVRSFSDLGFVVNAADIDAYTIPGGALRMNAVGTATPAAKWEKLLQPIFIIERDGSVRALRPKL